MTYEPLPQVPNPDVPGAGSTTWQIMNSPVGTLFVCANKDYTRNLMRKHGRPEMELELITPVDLERPERFFGRRFAAVVVDHSVALSGKQRAGLDRLRPLVRGA